MYSTSVTIQDTQIRSVVRYHVLTCYMGQKEKYDKMLFCLEYAENRHSYTIEKTHKEGHFAITIKNQTRDGTQVSCIAGGFITI